MSANGKTPFLTPKQELFLAYYLNPKSETFDNAFRSAIRAGYEENYAKNITDEMPDWLRENLGDMQMLRKAEKALNSTLADDYEFEEVIKDGELIETKVNPALAKIKQDSAKFVAERIGKHKYSTRTEVDTKHSGSISLVDKHDEELAKLAGLET